MKSKRIILASASPRRKELLMQAGFEFEVLAADIDEENYPPDLPIFQLPSYLAAEKAKKVLSLVKGQDTLVLAADSLVFLNEKIFTKPVDKDDAIRILESLAGKTHTVITGVCVLDEFKSASESVHTQVTFGSLDLKEIEYYIDNFPPFDKAGAYGIQDWIGLCKVTDIHGSYSNIMGLPMETVYRMLARRMKN